MLERQKAYKRFASDNYRLKKLEHTNLRGEPLRDRLRPRDFDRLERERERLLERDKDLRFFLARSRSSFSFNSFSKAARGSSITLER